MKTFTHFFLVYPFIVFLGLDAKFPLAINFSIELSGSDVTTNGIIGIPIMDGVVIGARIKNNAINNIEAYSAFDTNLGKKSVKEEIKSLIIIDGINKLVNAIETEYKNCSALLHSPTIHTKKVNKPTLQTLLDQVSKFTRAAHVLSKEKRKAIAHVLYDQLEYAKKNSIDDKNELVEIALNQIKIYL